MSVIQGTPPNPEELGMTAEEKALKGRPRAVIYFQPGHGDAAKEFAAFVRNAKTEGNQAPMTIMCDISRWDGIDLEDAQVVFIMRGMRDQQVTRFYQRNLPACDIFYLSNEGEVLGDRPDEIAPQSNPFAAIAERAAAARTQAADVPSQPSAGTPAAGAGSDADSAALDARPVPVNDQGSIDGGAGSGGDAPTPVGDEPGRSETSDSGDGRSEDQPARNPRRRKGTSSAT